MKQRIRKRILLYFLSLTVLTAILITVVGISFSKKATLNKFFYSYKYLAEEIVHNVNNVYKAAKSNIEIVSQNDRIAQNLTDSDKLKVELIKLKNLLAIYDDITISTPDGEVITSTDYNYTSGWTFAPFFIKTVETGKPQFSNAYYIPQPIRFITSFTAPILDSNGKVLAVVIAQLNMKKVTDLVSHLKLGKTGFASLIDPQKRTIYHPNQDKTLRVIHPLLQTYIQKKSPIQLTYKKQPYIGSSYTENNFTVVILQSKDEILQDMREIAVKVILTSSAIAIIVLLLGIKFSASLTRPIETLNDSIKRFSKGETQTQAPVISDDEIGDLTKVFNDMTSEVNKFRSQLESLVEQRTAELREAKDAAEEANKATGAFLANMSHEIRTPMNAILGFSEILSYQESNPQNKLYLDSIKNSGKNLLTLINDVLDMSKIESGNFSLTPKEASISKVIQDIMMMLKNEADKNHNKLTSKIPEDFPTLFVFDEIRIRQILTNLVGNAIKFTENGSIEIIAEYQINKNSENDASLTIKVKDTGIGISEEDCKSIFENFIQAKNQGDKLYQGAGLGLAISQKIACLMNGKLTVESNLNEGATFTFHIPSIQVVNDNFKNDLALSDSMIDMVHFENNKVLIVDDNEDNLRFLIKALENKNLDIKTATNGQAALDQTLEWKPELILMDLKIPVMNGYDSAMAITQKLAADTPTIIACSASLMDKQENPKAMNFKSFLRKPVDTYMLLNELIKYLPYSYTNTKAEES